jgi:uncharacterized protein
MVDISLQAHGKMELLKKIIRGYGSLAIAFSGGVDSTFLLKTAFDLLGDKAIAVTARSSTYPERELREAQAFAESLGIKHIIIDSEELDIPNYAENPVNRCYYCKTELFYKIKDVALRLGIRAVAEGSNADDLNDFRPGMQAVRELDIKSPLREADMTKQEIRQLSKEAGLPTWDKQAFACLASRFPYGQRITKEKLGMVDRAEQYLLDIGFRQVRVRHHGDLARIEVGTEERARFLEQELMEKVYAEFKRTGFTYVSLDLMGYRTGSMNEAIGKGMRQGGKDE